MYTYILEFSESDCQSCGLPVCFPEKIIFTITTLKDIFPQKGSVE